MNTEQRFEDAGLKAWSDPATSQGMPRPPEAERVGGQMRCSAQPPEGAGAQAADTLTAAHWGTHLSEPWENSLASFKAAEFVLICDSSHRKLICHLES